MLGDGWRRGRQAGLLLLSNDIAKEGQRGTLHQGPCLEGVPTCIPNSGSPDKQALGDMSRRSAFEALFSPDCFHSEVESRSTG